MAQIDTGLGWSAKDIYLMQSSGVIGSIGGMGELKIPNVSDISSPSVILAEGVQFWGWNTSSVYVIGVAPGVSASVFRYSDGSNNHFTVAATTESVLYLVDSSSPNRVYRNNIRSYDNTTHLYYWDIPQDYGYVNPDIPVYSSFAEGMSAIAPTSQNIYKLNSGYGVVAFVKWFSSDMRAIMTPCIISSNADYAALSLDGTTEIPGAGLYTGLIDGMPFYMRYYRNLSGDATTNYPVLDLSATVMTPKGVFSIISDPTNANIVVINSPDPYQEGDGSETGGGDGEDDDADNVDFTDPPSTSIGATGLLTIFCPNLYQLQSLGNYMWSTFDVDNWRKIIANPMDAILGLHTIPIPAVITGTKAVKVAGIDTTIDMSYTTVRYIRRSMGTCEIPKKWGAYLDYSPYTKISIFLPFIGFKELDADDIMGRTIALQYMVDVLTGACVAELKCGDTVLYTWSGNCANEVPISDSDWRGAIASAIGIAATVAGTALVTGGAAAPMAASMVASVGANSMNLKPTINRSGAISGSAGFMGQKRPYIIRSIPNLVIPTDQNKFIGYPSFVTTSLGSLTGYNEIASIHLEGIPATGNELAEIETLLKGGVIF